MLSCREWIEKIRSEKFDDTLKKLYSAEPYSQEAERQRDRYVGLIRRFDDVFSAGPDSAVELFSAPGRTEVGGNHVDHQHGQVICAGVDLDMLACAAPNSKRKICVVSEGYLSFEIPLDALRPNPGEYGTSAALIRGVAAGAEQRGGRLTGLNILICSDVPPGSGLSSSAAFEVLAGNIFGYFFCGGGLDAVETAKIGRQAENLYFGKPCGLMDQMASSIGGLTAIDFSCGEQPRVEKVECGISDYGYAMCIVNCGAGHAELTDEYASITGELGRVSAFFGKKYLLDVDEETFFSRIRDVRAAAGDRAVLRAIHIYQEDKRARRQVRALREKDFGLFLQLASESGRSSWMYLQNVIPCGASERQELGFALAFCGGLLAGEGACRVHGGGFAGTLQAFVPMERLELFRGETERVLGRGACLQLNFRERGGCRVEL